MSKNQSGNHLLYLLSEKKSLSWSDFRKYVELLYTRQITEQESKYFAYNLARDLSALGYIDIGETNDQTFVQVAPPMLVALPFIQPTFLLTGGRSFHLLKTLKMHINIDIKTNKHLPDTIIIKPEDIQSLEAQWDQVKFQGNQLSSYIKICKEPIAWSILEFAENLSDYEEYLNPHWHSGQASDIKEVFDLTQLTFKKFNQNQSLKKELSLIKLSHYNNYYKYYLFKKSNECKVKVHLDQGRWLILKNSSKSILKYNKKTFELSSDLRLPPLLERALTMLSGSLPQKERRKFIFKNVPYEIAKLIENKGFYRIIIKGVTKHDYK